MSDTWEDAPPYTLDIYDRCCAEGKTAYRAGLGRDACPYAYQDRERPVDFERDSWLDGYDNGFV